MAITKVTSGLISADAASVDLNIDAGTLYIDATNNRVGVGNTSPDLKLHVAHSDSNNGLLLEHTAQASGHQYLLNARQTEGLIFQRWTNGSFSSNTMTLDYNNRVGIGTTVPSQALTVSNTSGGISALIQTSTTGTGNLLFGDTDSDTSGRVQYQHTGNLMAFHTNGLERMKIDSSGLVTMTTAPAQATQERVLFLDVNCIGNQGSGYLEIHSGTNTTAKTRIEQVSSGGSGLYGTYIDTNIINVGNSASAHGNINFITNQAIRMTVGAGPNAGRVGIGTTSPGSILHLYANDPQILLDDSGTQSSITGQSGNILYKTSSINRDHVFFGVSTEAARITGDGNVGIGTSDPSYPLQISESANTNVQVDIETNSTNDYNGYLSFSDSGGVRASIRCDHYNNALKFNFGGLTTERMRINSSGQVSINDTTDPDASGEMLQVRGTNNTHGPLVIRNASGDQSAYRMIHYYKKEETSPIAITALDVTGSAVTHSYLSDERLKDELGSADGLNLISELNPIKFRFKDGTGTGSQGFTAQGFKQAFDNVGSFPRGVTVPDNPDEYWLIDDKVLIPNLVKAIQELKEENDNLKARIEVIENG